jgi:hypothetical protein
MKEEHRGTKALRTEERRGKERRRDWRPPETGVFVWDMGFPRCVTKMIGYTLAKMFIWNNNLSQLEKYCMKNCFKSEKSAKRLI